MWHQSYFLVLYVQLKPGCAPNQTRSSHQERRSKYFSRWNEWFKYKEMVKWKKASFNSCWFSFCYWPIHLPLASACLTDNSHGPYYFFNFSNLLFHSLWPIIPQILFLVKACLCGVQMFIFLQNDSSPFTVNNRKNDLQADAHCI